MKKIFPIICIILILMLATALLSCDGDKITVTFDSNGGSEIEAVMVEKNGTIPKPENPKRNGYVFAGWYIGDLVWNFEKSKIATDTTLKAKWVPIKYTITYKGAKCEGATSYTIEDEVVLENGFFDESDVDFLYWYTDLDKKTPVSKIEKGTTGNITLFAQSKFNYSDYELELTDNGYIIKKYNGTRADISIPQTYDGVPIIAIADRAFEGNTTLISIALPRTITTIGNYAFNGCTALTKIVIPKSVTKLGGYAFSNCTSLTIYCDTTEPQKLWAYSWNASNRPVIWEYQK